MCFIPVTRFSLKEERFFHLIFLEKFQRGIGCNKPCNVLSMPLERWTIRWLADIYNIPQPWKHVYFIDENVEPGTGLLNLPVVVINMVCMAKKFPIQF